ncbi:hypothetical protein EDD76_105138 [Kineothrix alysoides]|uniref:Uncharacterized protein n=1 Tax=Kineothrix alysoides TaxID=1469948 RepID=A0A4R1R0Y2_9FIRM|nr:hypothetical protein EDD76_105138 [Kineothrix alysoides]
MVKVSGNLMINAYMGIAPALINVSNADRLDRLLVCDSIASVTSLGLNPDVLMSSLTDQSFSFFSLNRSSSSFCSDLILVCNAVQ